MSNVKTNYVDYALKPVGSGNPLSLRKFETHNATTGALVSTIYVKDVTDYATVGSNILASDLNTIGNAVNSNSTNFASEYSPSATYAVGDYCTYQNVLYKCTTAIATPEAWNSAHWTIAKVMDVALKCEHGIAKANVPGNTDVPISIAKPAGWTKITGLAFTTQPLSSWDAFLIGNETIYGDDGNVLQRLRSIGTKTQDYNIHYTIIGY
jgi:Ca2+-binding RTX toxin-like protein